MTPKRLKNDNSRSSHESVSTDEDSFPTLMTAEATSLLDRLNSESGKDWHGTHEKIISRIEQESIYRVVKQQNGLYSLHVKDNVSPLQRRRSEAPSRAVDYLHSPPDTSSTTDLNDLGIKCKLSFADGSTEEVILYPSSKHGFFNIHGKGFDTRSKTVASSLHMAEDEDPITKLTAFGPAGEAFARAFKYGIYSLSMEDVATLEQFLKAHKAHLERRDLVRQLEQLARKVFPEIGSRDDVSGELLTACFKAHSKRPPEQFKGAHKVPYIDLIKVFRRAGGVVKSSGVPVRVDLVKPDKANDKAFRTMLAKRGVQQAKIYWTPPPLEFDIALPGLAG